MPETLFHRVSEHQEIELTREADGSLSLTIDGYWQFSTHDEHIFHEVLVDTAMVSATDPARVLVLGGGDGLALRNALRYPQVKRAVLCELDAAVIEMTRTVPQLIELSERSLEDPRVEVLTEDALVFLPRTTEQFDVVICDFPVPEDIHDSPLFNGDFYGQVARVLAPGGVVSVQVSREPDGFWPVLAAVESVLPGTQPRLARMADDLWANFILASHSPRAPCRPLAPGLGFLTATAVDDLVIRNREGDHFETAKFGREYEADPAPLRI